MMRALAAVALPFLVSAAPVPAFVDEEAVTPVLNDELIKAINAKKLGWTASRNQRFEGKSIADAKHLLGVVFPESNVNCPKVAQPDTATLPDSFDSRTQWPSFIHAVRDQQQCGSCWAFAASEALSDRLAIYSNGTQNMVLAPEGLVSCDKVDMGCGGGWPSDAANFLVNTGIPTETCEPYVAGGGQVPACPAACADGTPKVLYKYKSWDYCTGEAAMMAALQNGPIAVAFAVYQDFFAYKSGVYKAASAALAGYHAVKMLGYGVAEDKTPYWIVQNSWGPAWGEAGTFRIVRGINECGMELGALDKACPLFGIPLVQESLVV